MTRVGFYIVQQRAPEQRLAIAVRLADKAFSQGHRIFIHAEDRAQAEQLDRLLWEYRPASFLPHGLHGEPRADTIAIGWGQEPLDHNDLLINLQAEVPAFFSRFQRVAEVVTQDPARLESLRDAWRFYRERGYPLEKHEL